MRGACQRRPRRDGHPTRVLVELRSARGLVDRERPSPFTDAQDQALAPPPPPAWSDTDPDTRSLRPGDIPPEVRSRLDVRAAIIDLTDLGEPNNVLRRRTDSGVANGISEPALGSAIPLHFVPGDDQTLEVVIAPNPTALGDVVLTAPIDEIAAGAGFLISGSIKDRTIELRVLDEIELAARLGTTVDALRSFATMRCSGEPSADSTARTPRRCRPHVESRGGQRRDHR